MNPTSTNQSNISNINQSNQNDELETNYPFSLDVIRENIINSLNQRNQENEDPIDNDEDPIDNDEEYYQRLENEEYYQDLEGYYQDSEGEESDEEFDEESEEESREELEEQSDEDYNEYYNSWKVDNLNPQISTAGMTKIEKEELIRKEYPTINRLFDNYPEIIPKLISNPQCIVDNLSYLTSLSTRPAMLYDCILLRYITNQKPFNYNRYIYMDDYYIYLDMHYLKFDCSVPYIEYCPTLPNEYLSNLYKLKDKYQGGVNIIDPSHFYSDRKIGYIVPDEYIEEFINKPVYNPKSAKK